MKFKLLCLIPVLACVVSCERENKLPTAVAYAVPTLGDTTTVFQLEGNQSTDPETSYYGMQYRWDTDADGTWDCAFSARSSYATRFRHPGWCRYRLEVADKEGGTAQTEDSVFILSPNQVFDSLTDNRDGNRYRTVKIGNTWWMAENLRYGKRINSDVIPANNSLTEILSFGDDPGNLPLGGLYTWLEATNYPLGTPLNTVCPSGWKIPSASDWENLLKNYQPPYDVLYYLGPNSIEGLGVELKGYYRYGDPDHPTQGQFLGSDSVVRYWTRDYTGRDTTRYFTAAHFTRDSSYFVTSRIRATWTYHPYFPQYIIGYSGPEACYVRCVKQD